MQSWPSLVDQDVHGKRLLIREDFNVPMEHGKISDHSRLDRALPTIKWALQHNAAVILCSHLGRPQEGQFDPAFSLAPVAEALSASVGQEVLLVQNYLDGVEVEPGQVVLLENVRFNIGETANDDILSQRLASLCDLFVMDAFATAHRAQASTAGVAEFAAAACFGPLMLEELAALGQALDQPASPLIAVVGGAKVSTKIQLLESLVHKVDTLIVGGGIANTFLKAAGYDVGRSLYEEEFVALAQSILAEAQRLGVRIPLPTDVRVAAAFSAEASAKITSIELMSSEDMILDVGPQTAATYAQMMQQAATVVWNGPVGVFEFAAFADGTRLLGEAIAASPGYTLAGGGDTLAACSAFQLSDQLSYISTGGGAFLSYLQGDLLPAVAAIQNKENQYVR